MELINNEASTLQVIECQNDIVWGLIEMIVVHVIGLIHHDLFTVGVDRGHDSLILWWQVMIVEILVFNKENHAAWASGSICFPLKFKHTHSVVISSSKVIHGGVSSKDPEPISVLALLMNLHSTVHIPYPQGLVLWVWQQDFHPWVEKDTWDVISMALESIHLPMLISRQPPQLDSLIVCTRSNYFHSGMKSDPIDTLFMPFNDVFHFHFSATEYLVGSASLLLHTFFLKSWEVPYSYGLIEWCRCE